jgi:hypothetical protein
MYSGSLIERRSWCFCRCKSRPQFQPNLRCENLHPGAHQLVLLAHYPATT